ncbi:Uncharacterized protein Rs2_26322 [Raphanus sativus]|nr:Uncharacterized protein Rs2_26322 [Raphanus sativus]
MDLSYFRRAATERGEEGLGKRGDQWTEVLSWKSRAFVCHNFLSTVVDSQTWKSKESRVHTSSGTFVRNGRDKIIKTTERRIAYYTFNPAEATLMISLSAAHLRYWLAEALSNLNITLRSNSLSFPSSVSVSNSLIRHNKLTYTLLYVLEHNAGFECSSGTMRDLNVVLNALYEQNDKPSSALEFIQQKLGGPSVSDYKKLHSEKSDFQIKYNEVFAKHQGTLRGKRDMRICGHRVYEVSKSEIISVRNSSVLCNLANLRDENRHKRLL